MGAGNDGLGGFIMLEMKLLQSIGNQAAHTIELRYPSVQIKFFALKNGSVFRGA